MTAGDMSRPPRDLPPPRIGVRVVVVAALFAMALMGAGPMAALIGDQGSCEPACVEGPSAPRVEPSPGPSPRPGDEQDHGQDEQHVEEGAPPAPADPDPEPVRQTRWKLDAEIVEVTPPVDPNDEPDCLVEAQVMTRHLCLP